ncbi:unnamed protein product, partial [Haemonchus placei]|uniref:Chromo domain-containing protein n=1 Tax=Haemonchus placei TaxID=6290 RepID=A0A0N4X339_HAEPC
MKEGATDSNQRPRRASLIKATESIKKVAAPKKKRDDVYEVEAIISHVVVDNEPLYRVTWVGYPGEVTELTEDELSRTSTNSALFAYEFVPGHKATEADQTINRAFGQVLLIMLPSVDKFKKEHLFEGFRNRILIHTGAPEHSSVTPPLSCSTLAAVYYRRDLYIAIIGKHIVINCTELLQAYKDKVKESGDTSLLTIMEPHSDQDSGGVESKKGDKQ